jgi:peptide/nickel transport system substrate-binding protein
VDAVVFRLKQPWAPFLADLACFAASVLPQKLVEEQPLLFFDRPVGSGAFMVDTWERGSQLVLMKNPTYWDEGKPYLDEVVLLTMPDPAERVAQFEDLAIDVLTRAPYDQLDALAADSSVVIVSDPLAEVAFLSINVTRPPFDDPKLRQAINYAVDKHALIDRVLAGYGEPATTFMPRMFGHDATVPGYPFDPALAKELVAESSGKDGFTAELLIDPSDATGVKVAEVLTEQLAAVGGTVVVPPPEELGPRWVLGRYDLILNWMIIDIVDPDEAALVMVSEHNFYRTNYKSEQVDALITTAAATTNPDQRAAAYKELQAIVHEDAPFVLLWYPGPQTMTHQDVKDFHLLPTGASRLWETWRDPEAGA